MIEEKKKMEKKISKEEKIPNTGGPLLKIWNFKEMKESSEEEFGMRQILRDVTDVTKLSNMKKYQITYTLRLLLFGFFVFCFLFSNIIHLSNYFIIMHKF